ncbi:MAG: hypothetical protein KGL53_00240, partial [Elusimicrobia bacterium]|nr:hypothetical protein [Elusimicrobiota bacterium]
AVLREALARDPGDASAALTLGALLEGEGKPEEARALYLTTLRAAKGPLRAELLRRAQGR